MTADPSSQPGPTDTHLDTLFEQDEPYTYASVLADLLDRLRSLNAPSFGPSDEERPPVVQDITTVIATSLTDDHLEAYWAEGKYVWSYPADNTAHTDTDSDIPDHVSARVEYHPDGRIWAETKYADNPAHDYKTKYWSGWLSEYDSYTAYKMGALAAIRLLGAYTESGLTAAQALDLGATTGIGYKPNRQWATQRGVEYEAVRKNASNGRSHLLGYGWSDGQLNRDVFVARCGDCGRNKYTADGCDPTRAGALISVDGQTVDRLPFGDETQVTIENMQDNDVDEEHIESFRNAALEDMKHRSECPDCGVQVGSIHHFGCDRELCPRCTGQLFTCQCHWSGRTSR